MSEELDSSKQKAEGSENVVTLQNNVASYSPDDAKKPFYDAEARNRFEYEVEGGAEIAHVFGPLTDERYMQWNREFKVRGTEDDIKEEAREASVRLYDDIIVAVENIDYPEGADWRALLDSKYKIEALNDLLAVAIVEAEKGESTKLKLGSVDDTQTVVTEAWFNGEAVQQTHTLHKRSFELEKRFDRIQAKRSKTEQTRGLRRKAKVEYVPQDDKLGLLYDDMCVSVSGFTLTGENAIPLRFKVLVMTYVFGTKSKAKNLGK